MYPRRVPPDVPRASTAARPSAKSSAVSNGGAPRAPPTPPRPERRRRGRAPDHHPPGPIDECRLGVLRVGTEHRHPRTSGDERVTKAEARRDHQLSRRVRISASPGLLGHRREALRELAGTGELGPDHAASFTVDVSPAALGPDGDEPVREAPCVFPIAGEAAALALVEDVTLSPHVALSHPDRGNAVAERRSAEKPRAEGAGAGAIDVAAAEPIARESEALGKVLRRREARRNDELSRAIEESDPAAGPDRGESVPEGSMDLAPGIPGRHQPHRTRAVDVPMPAVEDDRREALGEFLGALELRLD